MQSQDQSCAATSPFTSILSLVSNTDEVPVFSTAWWLFCVFFREYSPHPAHRRILQGQARVQAPAACLINCHFAEEERGSSAFTTARKCPPGILLRTPVCSCLCVRALGSYVNSCPSLHQQQPHTSYTHTKVKAWMGLFFLRLLYEPNNSD